MKTTTSKQQQQHQQQQHPHQHQQITDQPVNYPNQQPPLNQALNHHPEKSKKSTKPNQLIHHIYSKTIQLVVDSRIDQPNQSNSHSILKPSNSSQQQSSSQAKLDKWFNLELQDPEYFKEELKTWKSTSSLLFNHSLSNSTSSSSFPSNSPQLPNFDLIPVLVLETILDIQQLPPDSFLTFIDHAGQEVSVDHRISYPSPFHQSTTTSPRSQVHKNIVIEKWSVSLVGPIPAQPNLELPTVYRHCIIHFRALYSFLRTMPASRLFQRLKNRNNNEFSVLKIGCRLSPASPCDQHQHNLHSMTQQNSYPQEVGILQPLSNSHPHPQDSTTNFNFPSIQTPFGSICTQVTYRNQVDFRIGDKERVLSSRFRHEDQLGKPLNLIPQSTLKHRPGVLTFTKSGASAPTSRNTNPHTQISRQSDLDSSNHTSEISSDYRRSTSYGPLSTWRRSIHDPPNPKSFDPCLTDLESTKASENFLKAEILAATQSSPFVSSGASNSTHRPQIGNVTTSNSSALTAKLVAHRQSLTPVLSNALPLPSAFNRPNPSVTTPGAGNTRIAGTGASPRQFSVLSSSPLSGPSSSIRISSAIRPPQYQRPSSTPGHLLPSTSPPTSNGSIGSYPPISGPLSPLSDQATTSSSSRPVLPSQPMLRRYSSSRHSRSFGQASSSGGGSLLTAESGSLGAKRTTFSISKQSSSSFDGHSKKLIDDDRNKINEFLQLINSQIIPPPPSTTSPGNNPSGQLSSPPDESSFSSHQIRKKYEKRNKEIKSTATCNTEPQAGEEEDVPADSGSNDKATTTTNLTLENNGNEEEESKLSRLMKEKLDLTLKKLAGNVFEASRHETPIRMPALNKLIEVDDNNNQNEHAAVCGYDHSGSASRKNLSLKNSNNRKESDEQHESVGVGLSSLIGGSSGLAILQGLKEEQEDELEHETRLNVDDVGSSIRNNDVHGQVDSIEVGAGGIPFEL